MIPKISSQRNLMDLAKIHEDPSRACSLHELRRGRLELGRLKLLDSVGQRVEEEEAMQKRAPAQGHPESNC